MTYQEILANARTCMGPYCKSCPICNGVACKNTVPGPGAKGLGTGFIRNYQKWQELCVNMDTICENGPADTTFDFFGHQLLRQKDRAARVRRAGGRHAAALRRQVR